LYLLLITRTPDNSESQEYEVTNCISVLITFFPDSMYLFCTVFPNEEIIYLKKILFSGTCQNRYQINVPQVCVPVVILPTNLLLTQSRQEYEQVTASDHTEYTVNCMT